MEKLIPGTSKAFVNSDAFKEFKKIIELTNGLSLGQVCSITGLEPMIIQNWVKRGYVARPIHKKYHEKQFARILLINSLKEAMRIEEIGKLMKLVNGDVEDESDDLLSETDLYGLFSKVVFYLKGNDYEKIIRQVMKAVNIENEKLYTALEVMINAYVSSEHKKVAKKYLKELENY